MTVSIFTNCLPLVKLLLIIKRIIPEPTVPKQRGRPFVYSLSVMMCCFVIMVVKGLSVRALHAFLSRKDKDAHEVRTVIAFPDGAIPTRRTFDRRLARWRESAILYIESATRYFATKKLIGLARLVTDRRMFQALGGLWHAKDKKQGIIPEKARNIDKTASWEKSFYRAWVYGHGLDVFVSIGKLVLPILATVRSLATHENVSIKQLIGRLPNVRKGSLGGDTSFYDHELAQKAKETGRTLQAPTRKGILPQGKTYRRRKVTVEPFFERLLLAFPHLRYKLPIKGESRVAGYLTTVVFSYQCAVILNVMLKNPPLEVTHFLQFL